MSRTIFTVLLVVCVAFVFAGTGCKMDAKKYGDENGQILCPVMGNKIDKQAYTDYKGKRVYFCCPACMESFNKEPEKYMKVLDGVKLDDAPAPK